MSVIPNIALKSLNDSLTSQDAHAAFQIVNIIAQHARSGVQEMTPKLSSSTQLASARSSVASCNGTGLAADHTLPPMSTPMLGDLQPNSFLNAGQQQLHPYRGRSKSLDTGLQSKELDCYFPTTKQSPTIAELIGTRYAVIMLQREGFSQGGSDSVFLRAKICFSCHKQMFLKWPYSCYLCSSVVCCDCCIK
ncbi:SPIR1 protein, partial [Odontophorus gujanensis]|nr:SPIR1 protein [Odontophorus gujanensis]